MDVAAVAEAAVRSKFHNGGQSCGAPSRFYLHERIHDAFVERFAELLADVRVGNGLDDVDMGPMANPRRVETLTEMVDDAVAAGAELVAGPTCHELGTRGHGVVDHLGQRLHPARIGHRTHVDIVQTLSLIHI